MRSPLCAFTLATLTLLLPAADAAAQNCTGDPGFEITVTPPSVEIGSSFEECLTTPPGGWVIYLFPSLTLGATPTPAGTLCVGPSFNLFVFTMPQGGQLCTGTRNLPCEPSYIGLTAYFQFIAVSTTQAGTYGFSNVASLTVVDGGCDDPCSSTMGDLVFADLDGDGLQDDGEPGIAGVTLLLESEGGELLGSAVTDGAGRYSFAGLCAGKYVLRVDAATVPAGWSASPCDAGGEDALDSDCSPVSVFLPENTTDGSLDFGFVPPLLPPGLALSKTASRTTIAPYERVTYTYTVTNTGGTPLTGIVVTDDNGTPDYALDDVAVGSIASLAPGASAVLTRQLIPVVCTGAVVNGTPVTAGAVIVVENEVSGDVQVTYLQDFGINDNTYGAGVIGWPGSNHKFMHLTGSDKLEFRIFDGNGNVVLDFYQDYLTASAAFPSGYGCLGATGGDGSLVSGSAASILSTTSSLADNLNHPANVPLKASLNVNSPTSLVAGNVVIDPLKAPGGWNPINSYTAVIKGSAFGAAGFGSVAVPDQHNSPNKLGGPNGMTTEPIDCTVVNTAKAVTVTAGGMLMATASAAVDIVAPPGGGSGGGGSSCDLRIANTKFDKKLIKITIENGGTADVVLDKLTLTWPAGNGKLLEIKLDDDKIYDSPDIPAPSANLAGGDFVADPAKRTITKGTSDVLTLVFQSNVDKDSRHYSNGLLTFGADCTLSIP